MKGLSFSMLLLLLLLHQLYAQENLPPVYEIKSDTALTQYLDNSYWQMLEDKDGKLGFEQVSKSPIANKFHYDTTKAKTFNPAVHTYWFRYTLKNVMNHEGEISFPSYGEQSDFYFITTDGKIIHEVNGFLTPWSKLNGLKLYRYIPVILKPGEELTIYHRLYNSYLFFSSSGVFSIVFSSTEKVIQRNYIDNESHYFFGIHDSFIFGVLAFASIFIFFFYLIVHEKVYLYFSLYLFFLGFGRFNIGSELYHVFFREAPALYEYIVNLCWIFPTFFLTLFIRALLQTRIYLPRWDKLLIGFNILYVISYLFAFFKGWGGIGFTFHDLTEGALIIAILLTFILSFHKRSNKLLMFGVFPVLFIWGIGYSVASIYRDFQYNLLSKNFTIWVYNNWFLIETISLSVLVMLFSWILLHRFSELRKQIAQQALEKEIERSQLIAQQKVELEKQVEERTAELKQSLQELKSTQAQLIQSEKMASLGEITAGIAHEIQNPLNFVNNFSEVNTELIDEMQQEMDKGNYTDAKAISNDIRDNEQKIIQHGKRADTIVKGMLQHSRSSIGVKESTNINTLADEYLRLSYHGLRAKDKTFNATLQTEFDESIGKINIIPQDIGRVLLNLYNNAFYAVTKKKNTNESYDPTVSVSTKKLNDKIEVRVKDNGNGIPQKVIDKIFQPFFTTKPTGQGTGLGLSLSYDIIKAHGGEIKVETKEDEGSTFIIHLSNTVLL